MSHLSGLPRAPQKRQPHHQRPRPSQSEEIKRRNRVVRIFPNREACLRLVTALAVEHSEEWVTGRRYLDMREFEEHLWQEREAEGAILMKQ